MHDVAVPVAWPQPNRKCLGMFETDRETQNFTTWRCEPVGTIGSSGVGWSAATVNWQPHSWDEQAPCNITEVIYDLSNDILVNEPTALFRATTYALSAYTCERANGPLQGHHIVALRTIVLLRTITHSGQFFCPALYSIGQINWTSSKNYNILIITLLY